jgi:uncharacterized membrane protein YgcG
VLLAAPFLTACPWFLVVILERLFAPRPNVLFGARFVAPIADDGVCGVSLMKLYVGNLSYSTTQDALYDAFGAHGKVDEVAVVTDRETGRPRGFAFVSMNNDQEARAAIEALNGADVDGRTITVNEARPKENNRGGGGYGGGGGRGRGGYGGGGGRGGYGGGGGDRW